jgi:hypothetical protein
MIQQECQVDTMEDVRNATRALSVKYARGFIIFYPKLDFLVGLLFDVVSACPSSKWLPKLVGPKPVSVVLVPTLLS